MKTLNYLCVTAALLTLMVFAVSQTQAAPIPYFSYGFEDMTTYPFTTTGTGVDRLTGQVCADGKVWKTYMQKYPTQTTYDKGFEVGYKTGDTVDSTVVIKQGLNFAGSTGIVGNCRDFVNPYKFTAADTAVETTLQLYVNGTLSNGGTVWGGIDFDLSTIPGVLYGPNLGKIAIARNTQSVVGTVGTEYAQWISNDYGSQPPSTTDPTRRYYVAAGTPLTFGNWYEFKGVMDFSVYGGQVSWSIKNLSTGETSFTPLVFKKYSVNASPWTYLEDVTAVPLGLVPNANGEYIATGFGFVAQRGSSYELYADNFTLGTQIPEPSTLALLAGGLFGLLAYAWRKRK
jgi:hypothetical protein